MANGGRYVVVIVRVVVVEGGMIVSECAVARSLDIEVGG